MMETLTQTLRDPRQAWVTILEAAQRERPEELADIAFSLYGQLGEAQAEICRLRTSLHASLRALAPARLDGYYGY
jgi:hypothetical protein